MTNNYSVHILRTRWLSNLTLIALLIIRSIFASAQTACPTWDGNTRNFYFTGASNNPVYFPSTVPPSKTGDARSTAGRLLTGDPMNVVYPLRTVTINPEFTDGTLGSSVLRFDLLNMAGSSAIIRIYAGATATGTPEVINSSNASSKLLQTRVFSGPVTVTFENPTAGPSGNFNIRITYTTGDQVVTSPFGFQVAYWTNFITPNSYIALENYPDWAVPIATAYFNESKQLVSSEISFCTDYGQTAPSIGNSHFPGQFVFHPTLRPDFDENGTVEPIDRLVTARMAYILSHAPQPIKTFANFRAVQTAINYTNDDPNGNYGGLFGQAKAAIPSLNSPVEPTFSLTGPSSAVPSGTAQNFVFNLTNDGGYARTFSLEVPTGVNINSVTGSGVTYDAVNKTITFASAPGTANIAATSALGAVATLRVIYNQPGFWNVNNLVVYEPCDSYPKATYQGFLGISKGHTQYPFREARATWTAAPCYNDEKITNGGFDGNANGWNVSGGGWEYVTTNGGEIQNQDNAGTNQILWQTVPALTTQPYRLSFKLGSTDRDNSVRSLTASLEIKIGGVTYATFNNGTGTSNNVTLTLANGATSTFIPYSSGNARIDRDVTIDIPYNIAMATPGIENQIHFVFNATGDDFYLDNISLLGCAQAEAFLCNDSKILYSGTSASTSTLYDVNYTATPVTRTSIGSAAGISYNAIGFNTVDGFIYGIRSEVGANSNHLVRIQADGNTTDLGAVTGLPTQAANEYNSGDFDAAGFLYVMTNSSTSIYKIDVVNKTATAIPLSPTVAVSDIAYHNGIFYGVKNSNSQLVSIATNGTVTDIGTSYTTGVFGAMMGACDGIYGIANSGGLYRFDIATGVRTKLADTPSALSGVDGAHCHTACIDTGSLPVKLISFNATKEGTGVNLSWSTTEEVNSSYFGVEHSLDAKNWNTLTRVKSHGESVVKRDYNYTHATPSEGINYYRLKMVDLDETFAYSAIESSLSENVQSITLYPNPVHHGKLTVKMPGSGVYQVEVYNLAGVRVLHSRLEANTELNVSKLMPGAYVLRVKSEDGSAKASTFLVN